MKEFFSRNLAHPGIKRSNFFRRCLAISLVVLGLAFQMTQHASTTEKVIVFSADVSPGTTISAELIEEKELPPSAIPHGAIHQADEILGSTTAAAHTRGSVITTFSTASEELLEKAVTNITGSGGGEEINLVPIKLSDPTIANLLRQGNVVTVVSTRHDNNEKEIIAAGGIVIYSTKTGAENFDASPGTVMLALPTAAAEAVAARSLTAPLTVVVTGK